jgi:hypothetical protein
VIDQTELLNTPLLDNGGYLTVEESRRIAEWLDSIFDDGVENYPWGSVGAALCEETFLLDSRRALTDPEIERILAVIWWEGARCGEGE